MQLKVAFIAVSLCVAMTPTGSFAGDKDVTGTFDIAPVLANAEYAAKLGGTKFYFGDQDHPSVARQISADHSSKRSMGGAHAGAASETGCQRAFAGALIAFADKAKLTGGDAVIDVQSGFGDKTSDSSTSFICGSGRMMSGMTVTGKIVKLH